jgi:hypothetical protein
MEPRKRLFYDLTELISADDPPKIKRLKQSYKTESEGDFLVVLGVVIFAIGILIRSIC